MMTSSILFPGPMFFEQPSSLTFSSGLRVSVPPLVSFFASYPLHLIIVFAAGTRLLLLAASAVSLFAYPEILV